MENNEKRIYRLAPYSVYEYDRIEKYLEEMAQKGYFFESVFCGVMSFKIDKPQKARYRLEAIDKKRDENDDMALLFYFIDLKFGTILLMLPKRIGKICTSEVLLDKK